MAKSIYDYSADISFEDAARLILRSGFRKMMDNAKGTRAGLGKSVASSEEIESLHDMRVGSRRLRAALSVFGKIFSKNDLAALDEEVGRITDALGAVRDLDVQLDSLRSMQNALPANEAFGVGRLIERQGKKRDLERKALLSALDKLEKSQFERRFKRLLSNALPNAKAEPNTGDGTGEAAAA